MGKAVKPRRQCGSDGSGNKEGEAERQGEDNKRIPDPRRAPDEEPLLRRKQPAGRCEPSRPLCRACGAQLAARIPGKRKNSLLPFDAGRLIGR